MVHFSPLIVFAAVALNIVPGMAAPMFLDGEHETRDIDTLETRGPHDIASVSLASRDFELETRSPQIPGIQNIASKVAKKLVPESVEHYAMKQTENYLEHQVHNAIPHPPHDHPNSGITEALSKMHSFRPSTIAAMSNANDNPSAGIANALNKLRPSGKKS